MGALLNLPDANTFYEERDARIEIEHPLTALSSQHIAVVVPPEITSSANGFEIALFWTTSMIRRMGKPFAELIIVSSKEFRQSHSALQKNHENTIEKVISEELRAADPFASFEWRNWGNGRELEGASAVIWLGTWPLGMQEGEAVAINAHGWIATMQHGPESDLSLLSADFDAAPATIIMAACFAVARVFSNAFQHQEHANHLAFALDSGAATAESQVYRSWLKSGSTLPSVAPWKVDMGEAPRISKLLIVSAGGVGGNFCNVLAQSYLNVESAIVQDPDRYEISNLNRSVGVGVHGLGSSKASIAAEFLKQRIPELIPIEASYESWATSESMSVFAESGTAVVVGVDQVRSRLSVGSDWPSLLLNGATSGTTFSSGIHFRRAGGCIGCWYGQNDAAYIATRTAMACVAGVAPGLMEQRPTSSYPFVSVAAAAQLVAALSRAAFEKNPEYLGGTVTTVSLRLPEFAQTKQLTISDRCLLICAQEYVQKAIGREAPEVAN